MFDNIGSKIKSVASAFAGIGIVLSIIFGFVMIVIGYDEWDVILMILGPSIIVFGSLFSWLASLALYGFGQLIENTDPSPRIRDDSESDESINPDDYTEEDFMKELENEHPKKQNFLDFKADIDAKETAVLELIVQDQQEYYSEVEMNYIKKVLADRKWQESMNSTEKALF